ncbi:MAG: DUF4340 domain-containing protein [Verrucomicrobiales bacterium]
MRPITTIVLLVLTALAIGFIFFIERRQLGTVEAAERTRVLLTLGSEEVRKIEITNAAGRVRLERGEEGGWQLTSPVKDRADAKAVATLLELATGTEVLERLSGDDVLKKSRLRELGLDASQQGRVTFYPRGGGAYSIMLGKPAPAPGSLYVQLEEGDRKPNEVLVVRVPWTEPLLARSPGEWRDPRLVMAPPDSILRIAIRSSESEIELQRDLLTPEERKKNLTALWQLTKPIAERADQALMTDNLLPGLVSARAQSFSEPGSTPSATGPAAVQVVVWSESGPPEGETLDVFPGSEPDTAWVQVGGRPGQARAGADLLALRGCTLDRMRDPKLAAIEVGRITTVILRQPGATEIPLYLHQNTWYLAHEGLVHEANRDRVQSLVEAFNEAMVLQWFDTPEPAEAYGFDHPLLEIVFGTAAHTDRARPVSPTAQDSATLNIGQRQNRFYAQWAGRPTVMRFDGSILGSVSREWIRFKSPRILGFAPLSVRQLSLTEDPAPTLECHFDHASGARWSASRQGTDVTEFLDVQQLERLVNRLSEFEAHDWSSDPGPGLEALRQPRLVVDLVIEQFDEATGEPKPAPVRLALAPTVPGERTALYYGRLNDDPNVFVVRRALVEELLVPVLRSKPEAATN